MQHTHFTLPLVAALMGLVATSGCSSSGDDDAQGSSAASGGNAAGSGGSSGTGGSNPGSGGTTGGTSPGSGGTTGGSSGSSASGAGGTGATSGTTGVGGSSGTSGRGRGGRGGTNNGGAGMSSGGKATGGSGGAAAGNGGNSGAAGSGGSSETGWLYTQGNKIYLSDGNGGGTPWVGRGVNMSDIFFCGYNSSLWMDSPGDTLTTLANNLITSWKPTFIRVSLSMDSFQQVSWLKDEATYKTPMTDTIHAMGQHPGVYVLVTLRTDSTETGTDEATRLPSNNTDPLYQALVDTFANDAFVLFGVSNEPGGNTVSPDQLKKTMDHAVSTIRAEEDKLGVPHHLVSVQGNNWTSDVSFYNDAPLKQDNVVYEVHGYPPPTDGYTFDKLPIIIGEYGGLDSGSQSAFYADLEKKQIPNLAWDFEPYSNCQPDLLVTDQSPSNLTPTDWGKIVKKYLGDHAP